MAAQYFEQEKSSVHFNVLRGMKKGRKEEMQCKQLDTQGHKMACGSMIDFNPFFQIDTRLSDTEKDYFSVEIA